MKQILVLGQTNAGKTLFTINFAIYLGASDISLTFRTVIEALIQEH